MFVTGLGVGPTFAVFPLIVQNSVPVPPDRVGGQQPDVLPAGRRHGRAGDHGHGVRDVAGERAAGRDRGRAGVPPRVGARAGGGAGGATALTGVGDTGAAILASLPAGARALVEPFLPAIVDAIHQAFSIATASTFAIGIVTCIAAAGLVLAFRDAPAAAGAAAPRGRGRRRDPRRSGRGRRLTPPPRSAIRRRVIVAMPGASNSRRVHRGPPPSRRVIPVRSSSRDRWPEVAARAAAAARGDPAGPATSPAASGGRIVVPVTEEDFRCAA